MASTIKLKNGSGAPTTGDLVQGEPALDLTNKRLYTENASGGVVIEVGTNPSTIDINSHWWFYCGGYYRHYNHRD
jgi:hypothetical protein